MGQQEATRERGLRSRTISLYAYVYSVSGRGELCEPADQRGYDGREWEGDERCCCGRLARDVTGDGGRSVVGRAGSRKEGSTCEEEGGGGEHLERRGGVGRRKRGRELEDQKSTTPRASGLRLSSFPQVLSLRLSQSLDSKINEA